MKAIERVLKLTYQASPLLITTVVPSLSIIILSVHHLHLMGARETFLVRLEIRGLEDREPGKTTRTTTAAR